MNQNVTIVLPVSREDYLDKVFATLELTECNRNTTNLLVIVDGDSNLFVKTRNFVEMSKFAERLCIKFSDETKTPRYSTQMRAKRIAKIHNEIKEHIWKCDYIFGLEDDTIIPYDAIKKLLRNYSNYPHAGFIQGVELGRWGVPYVGAWQVDDVYEPTKINSILPGTGLQEIDAGGFYCFLTTRDNYATHNFKPWQQNGLGPDVDFGLTLREMGQLNYIDWSIRCVHKRDKGPIGLHNTKPQVVSMNNDNGRWRHDRQKPLY